MANRLMGDQSKLSDPDFTELINAGISVLNRDQSAIYSHTDQYPYILNVISQQYIQHGPLRIFQALDTLESIPHDPEITYKKKYFHPMGAIFCNGSLLSEDCNQRAKTLFDVLVQRGCSPMDICDPNKGESNFFEVMFADAKRNQLFEENEGTYTQHFELLSSYFGMDALAKMVNQPFNKSDSGLSGSALNYPLMVAVNKYHELYHGSLFDLAKELILAGAEFDPKTLAKDSGLTYIASVVMTKFVDYKIEAQSRMSSHRLAENSKPGNRMRRI